MPHSRTPATLTGCAPLDRPPRAIRPPFDIARPDTDFDPDMERWRARRHADRAGALLEVLDGIELGAYDRELVEHLAAGDDAELGGLVSLFLRARASAPPVPDRSAELVELLAEAGQLVAERCHGPGVADLLRAIDDVTGARQ